MAKFLQSGKFRALYALPELTECASEKITFLRRSPTQLTIDRLRRDRHSFAGRLLFYERARLQFHPLSSDSQQ